MERLGLASRAVASLGCLPSSRPLSGLGCPSTSHMLCVLAHLSPWPPLPGVHGCMVANAHAELRDWCAANGGEHIYAAQRDGPGGIFDALHHFGWGAA